MKELIETLRDGYDPDPSSQVRELERLADLCNKAADAIEEYEKAEQMRNEDPYRVLSKINVNEHTEKKNGLTYLSWAWAWDTLMSLYPESSTTINRDKEGMPFWTDGKTAWVDVSVVLKWNVDGGDAPVPRYRERSEVFPIMDYRNKSIPLDKITSFDVNTALQRAWTKCIARHGLGFYIYAGADLPFDEYEAKKQAEEEAKKQLALPADLYRVQQLYSQAEIDKMLKRMKKELHELTAEEVQKMIAKRDTSLLELKEETY